jgi:hypothetical protein
MHPQEFEAIKKYSEGLRGCLEATLKTYKHDNPIDNAISAGLNHAISLINFHLSLAELMVDKTMGEMASNYGENK